MNRINERQHYVSQVLLERFRLPGEPLYCYQLDTGRWHQRSVARTCSAKGYNQLALPGTVDNTLEADFSRIETHLPKIFSRLEHTALKRSKYQSLETYSLLCNYFTFLKLCSPVAKASAPFGLVAQMNMELQNRQYSMLHDLNVPETTANGFRKEYLRGGRLVIRSENILQFAYRFQFSQLYRPDYGQFFVCHWKIWNSPIDLPMSDVGLVPIHLEALRVNLYILPISPRLVLTASLHFEPSSRSTAPCIKGADLRVSDARYLRDIILASAISEIISSRRISDMSALVAQAKSGDSRFNRIVNIDRVLSAGRLSGDPSFRLEIVSGEEYRQFVHSFILPPQATPMP